MPGPSLCRCYYSCNNYPNTYMDIPISRWDEGNWDVVIETFLESGNRNDLFGNLVPGAVRELYNILGTPCYTPDTDILTEDGWINIEDYVEGEFKIPLATLNPSSNMVEYHVPINYVKEFYNGKLFYQNSNPVNIKVTPNHKLWVKPIQGKRWKFYEARDCPKEIEYSREFNVDSDSDIDYFILPEYERVYYTGRYCRKEKFYKAKREIPMDLWIEFFGWYLSEGHSRRGHSLSIAQNKNIYPENCKLIERCISDLGYDINYNGSSYCIYDSQLATYLQQFGLSYEKYIPRELFKCSKRQLKILLHSLMLGDGYMRNGEYCTYVTTSKQLADDILELGIICDYNVTISENDDSNDNHRIQYILYFSSRKYSTPQVNQKKDEREYVLYNGYVYCVDVPNHIIMVKQNGKAIWCGNSFIDTTYTSGNTLILEPQSGYGLSGVRQKRTIAVKNIQDSFINENWFFCKFEGRRLDT